MEKESITFDSHSATINTHNPSISLSAFPVRIWKRSNRFFLFRTIQICQTHTRRLWVWMRVYLTSRTKKTKKKTERTALSRRSGRAPFAREIPSKISLHWPASEIQNLACRIRRVATMCRFSSRCCGYRYNLFSSERPKNVENHLQLGY